MKMPDTAMSGARTSPVDAALAALTALHPKKIDLGLDRIERVLGALGNPQDKLPPIVHVAGTNGKGSTVAFLRAFAEAQGLSVHVYTSPHLVHFRERIVVASEMISDGSLVDVLTRVREANAGAQLSFFEATTAAAFLAFSETPADLCLLEVGLGGRYDATNVIPPACAGITPIDYDHAEFLGRDLAGIAREKAGIMKPHVPAIIGAQSPQVADVLDAQGAQIGIKPLFFGQDFHAYRQGGRLIFEDETELLDLPLPNLIGDHQIQNAGLAIAIARQMRLSTAAIEHGLTQAVWPARLQNITQGPLLDPVIAAGGELWLDGGHNPHAARAVASAMAELGARSPRPLILITGILANKDIGGFLDAFQGLARAVIGVTIPDHASLAPETLTEMAQTRGMTGAIADDIHAAIGKAIKMGHDLTNAEKTRPPRIMICGSLYLSGQVLALNA